MTILIADDDQVMTSILSHQLTEKGFKVVVVGEAFDAWISFTQRRPDAVILNCQMPEGIGFAVLKQLKKSHEISRIPVIALGGDSNIEEAAKVRAMGADEFLERPLDLSSLYSALRKVLGVPV